MPTANKCIAKMQADVSCFSFLCPQMNDYLTS
jgi:hypothetical protein